MTERVVTGYRPTGHLHLGHYHGVIKNMLELQQKYQCFFFIADWHALTTDYETPENIARFTESMVIDWLAAGISPDRAVIYRQSDVPQVAELTLYFGMITPLGWLERNPTYKEQLRELMKRHLQTYGFLGYPVLQAADILIVLGEVVPVGEDQLPHLELTREIARRFNSLYGDYFPEPAHLLSSVARVPGTDGRKMSKSYDNAIFLSDEPDVIREKVMNMFTDPERIYRKDPGHPDRCPLFALHQLHAPEAEAASIKHQCLQAEIGCRDCKALLAKRLIADLKPFRDKRAEIARNPHIVSDVLEKGREAVAPIAQDVISNVRKLLKIRS